VAERLREVAELFAGPTAITRRGGCPAAGPPELRDRLLWIYLLAWIIIDIFRSRDLGGWAKCGWLILILVLPFIGVFAYVITRVPHSRAPGPYAVPRAGHARQESSCRRRTSRTWTPKVSSLASSPCSAA